VKESCLLDRKDEQALVQLTRRSARSPRRALRRALEIVTTVINSGALRFVPHEDLQTEGYGAYRNLRNQATTTKGAKR
jgi:hypothetical protein